MKWYFAVNEKGLAVQKEIIEVSVNSCLKNTSLTPFCLYVGEDNSDVEWLRNLGVNVVFHEPSIKKSLIKGYGNKYEIFNGHWLRCDLPVIENDRYVLYTDIDVVFLKDPVFNNMPEFLAAAPEHKLDDYSYFNSGVMLLNLDGIRRVYDDFIRDIVKRLETDFKYPAHDQKSFNDFFVDTFHRLDPIYNWKPYWGVNDEAVILHFHGPKPKIIKRFERNNFDNVKSGLIRIWKKNPEAYKKYIKDFYAFLD